MRVRVHVERLVLDGLPLAGADREPLASALVTELSARLGDGACDGLVSESLARVRAPGIVLRPGAGAAALGTEIGRAVYEGIHASTSRESPRIGGGHP